MTNLRHPTIFDPRHADYMDFQRYSTNEATKIVSETDEAPKIVTKIADEVVAKRAFKFLIVGKSLEQCLISLEESGNFKEPEKVESSKIQSHFSVNIRKDCGLLDYSEVFFTSPATATIGAKFIAEFKEFTCWLLPIEVFNQGDRPDFKAGLDHHGNTYKTPTVRAVPLVKEF